jgi:hypothetical protein
LDEKIPCRSPTGDDCLEEIVLLLLDERHQVRILVTGDDQNALARILDRLVDIEINQIVSCCLK